MFAFFVSSLVFNTLPQWGHGLFQAVGLYYNLYNQRDAKNPAAGSLTELSEKFIFHPLFVFFFNASVGDSSNRSRFGGLK